MSKIVVPAVPQLELTRTTSEKIGELDAPAPKTQSPLDAAFLARIYRSMLWFGCVLAVLVALGLKSGPVTVSFASGIALAAVLLKAQEIGVRALMRPKEQLGGFDARLALVLFLPLKFLLVGGALLALSAFGLILPAYLAVGFFAGQLVIVAKVVGWMMTRPAQK